MRIAPAYKSYLKIDDDVKVCDNINTGTPFILENAINDDGWEIGRSTGSETVGELYLVARRVSTWELAMSAINK